ncbi:MAG TPA: class I SAM-dependent methyltransferase, partial [Microlunatus sp.]
MTELKEPTTVDVDTLMAFVFRCVDEVGASLSTAQVVMGDRLGYYRAMTSGPTTPSKLAQDTGTAERYAREWLNAQAAGGIVSYDVETGDYRLPPEQAVAMTDESSPAYLPGFFQLALGSLQATDKIIEAARTGDGYGWDEQTHNVHQGCERFFRPGYNAHLLAEWLPALDGVVAKLETGAKVADIGCGFGASTIIMANAFPNSRFTGSDYHAESLAAAREAAEAAGLD